MLKSHARELKEGERIFVSGHNVDGIRYAYPQAVPARVESVDEHGIIATLDRESWVTRHIPFDYAETRDLDKLTGPDRIIELLRLNEAASQSKT